MTDLLRGLDCNVWVDDVLKVDHRFAVAYTPWSNGTCECMVREVVRALRSILSEQRKQVAEWVDVCQPLRGL